MGMMEKSKFLNKMAIAKLIRTIQPRPEKPVWIQCPNCKVEWNELTPSGVCVECEEKSCDC